MGLSEEKASPTDSEACRTLISIVTESGFTIVRACDSGRLQRGEVGKYCFVVENPDGVKQKVTIEFSTAAVALIQRLRRSPLPTESPFWVSCAERSLATYLWEENRLPPDGRLLLEEICLDDLETARRWDSD